VFRWLRRRRESAPDPAAELRAKLEESRSVADERDEFEAGETPLDRADPDAGAQVAPPPVDEADPEARRRAVHEQTRARIDELSGRDEG
jgi:hypothetical protein